MGETTGLDGSVYPPWRESQMGESTGLDGSVCRDVTVDLGKDTHETTGIRATDGRAL